MFLPSKENYLDTDMRSQRRWVRAQRCLWLSVLLLVAAPRATAAPADAEQAPGATPEAEVAVTDSPRTSLLLFLQLTRAGNFTEAARFMELTSDQQAEGGELARQLKLVLDRHVWFDLSKVSDRPGGNLHDDLPAAYEQIAEVPGPGGGLEPVRLVRRGPEGARWQFGKSVVSRIPSWYESLDNRWLLEHLPLVLLRPGPHDLLWWQWIALPLLLLLAWGAARVLGRVTLSVLGKAASMTRSVWDEAILARIAGPLAMAYTLGLLWVALPLLDLYEPAEAFLHRGLRAGLFVVFFWSLARLVDVVRQVLASAPWGREHPASRSLLPLGARVVKVVLLAIAVVALLSEMGYPVASLVAGLGIGGLALALAAQKTVENLFGAFSIGADQPFREGDLVRIEEFVATVEAIGLRSTRFRTLERTLISIPNGRLADMRLESLAARDRMRLYCVLGLVYSTTASQMRQVLAGVRQALETHPNIWPDGISVRLTGLGASSLDIEVAAALQTTDFAQFQAWREELLLSFMEIVEKAGSSFAFPTQTLHLVSEPAAMALPAPRGGTQA